MELKNEAQPLETRDQRRARELEIARQEIPDALLNIPAEDVIRLWEFLQVTKAHHNNNITPVEDFIVNLPGLYCVHQGHHEGLTPDIIADELKEMQEWFEEAISTARHFQKNHAGAIAEPVHGS